MFDDGLDNARHIGSGKFLLGHQHANVSADRLSRAPAEKLLSEFIEESDRSVAGPSDDGAVGVLNQLAIPPLACAQRLLRRKDLFVFVVLLLNVIGVGYGADVTTKFSVRLKPWLRCVDSPMILAILISHAVIEPKTFAAAAGGVQNADRLRPVVGMHQIQPIEGRSAIEHIAGELTAILAQIFASPLGSITQSSIDILSTNLRSRIVAPTTR